jgi:nucleoid-associated protein YgaU
MSDTLFEGQRLERGDSLASGNGTYTLTLQDDGDLVLAARGRVLWATATDGHDVVRAELQHDGNFVLHTREHLVWRTDTGGSANARLVPQDDGNLVLYAGGGPVWASHTRTDDSPAPAGGSGAPDVADATAGEPGAEPGSEGSAERTYTVIHGDTLSAIAARFYGDGSKDQAIAEANGIPDPDLIHPGQVLIIP